MTHRTKPLVLGLGTVDRADDGVGPALVARLADAGLDDVDLVAGPRDAAWILDAWSGRPRVLVLDAVRSDRPVGHVMRVDPRAGPFVDPSGASTHGLGLASAIELGRALGDLPERLVLIGVEGACFDLGAEMSPPVRDALPEAAESARRIVETWHADERREVARA